MKAPLNVLLTLALYGLTSCLVREHIHVDKIMTWLEAQEYCRLHYDDLSTLSTQQEVKQLVDIEHLSCPTSTGYHWWCVYGRWTGLYTNTLTLPVPIWKWSGGENETLCTWANGEPNKMPDEACGLIFIKMGQCYNVPCSWNLSFFCMDMYEVILVQKNKTWQKALDYCRKHYIDLVSLKADNWMKNAVEVTKAAQTAYVWTGLYFLSGEWFWAKGDALEYQAWSTEGQPQCPATNHRCVALGQKEEIWQPRACEEKLNFLCFQKLHYQGSQLTTLQTSSVSAEASSSSTTTTKQSTKKSGQ